MIQFQQKSTGLFILAHKIDRELVNILDDYFRMQKTYPILCTHPESEILTRWIHSFLGVKNDHRRWQKNCKIKSFHNGLIWFQYIPNDNIYYFERKADRYFTVESRFYAALKKRWRIGCLYSGVWSVQGENFSLGIKCKCFQILFRNNLYKFKYRYNISIRLCMSRSEANAIKSINQKMYN